MNLDDILYVEVNLERPLVSDAFAASTDFAVVLEHCWGTPYNDRSGEMKYFIIKNQCPVRGNFLSFFYIELKPLLSFFFFKPTKTIQN